MRQDSVEHGSDSMESNRVRSHVDETTLWDENEDDNNGRGRTSPSQHRWSASPGHWPSLRHLALSLSLYFNIAILVWKLVAYLQTSSLSVLAALLDSVLDVVSQVVLYYTEKHSSLQRSSAFYPAGASRLEPIGVLTCAALMGMASFEVLKQSITKLISAASNLQPNLSSVVGMSLVVIIKLALLWLCRRGALKRQVRTAVTTTRSSHTAEAQHKATMPAAGSESSVLCATMNMTAWTTTPAANSKLHSYHNCSEHDDHANNVPAIRASAQNHDGANPVQEQGNTILWETADPTLEALAQDHWNDCLSNGVAVVALVVTMYDRNLWFLDPIGAIIISLYIIYSWYTMGKEQIEHLTGKSAPAEFIAELVDLANGFDERISVDTVRAYHFGSKFLVEIEVVMDASTHLFESHDVGMALQYKIEGREEVERCFVHIDYQNRPYDEHVVSKVPELLDKYTQEPLSRELIQSSQTV
jgi:cation diffusion facilitator family transporter